ncbi:MAG: hypothetical protein MK097_17000, partial [Dechloromonas sp.]|nr:hypothetical protein [Dechloromonas sp.]
MDATVARRHWHQNDPGSIPNVYVAGSGSPSGITVYEGKRLGADLDGAVLHCEPGHNEVRVFAPRSVGAGYEVDLSLLIDGQGDQWFRPVDVAAAPDGSLLVADWYDPGVGGHGQRDIERGRIYRLAPPGVAPAKSAFSTRAPAQWARALSSPNEAVRRTAREAILAASGPTFDAAYEALEAILVQGDLGGRARALWLLAELPGGQRHLRRAADDPEVRLRMTALRAARLVNADFQADLIGQLVADPSPQVRRVCAIELQRLDDNTAAPLWARLAQQHTAEDRWMVEALGLAADGRWDACLEAWDVRVGEEGSKTAAGRAIIWRSQSSQTIARIVRLLADPSLREAEVLRMLRAVDFNEAADRDQQLTWLVEQAAAHAPARRALLTTEALLRLGADTLDARQRGLLLAGLSDAPIDGRTIDLVTRFRVAPDYDGLLAHAISQETSDGDAMRIVRLLLAERQFAPLEMALS